MAAVAGVPADARGHELRVVAVMKLGERTRLEAERLLAEVALPGLTVDNQGDGTARVMMTGATAALIRGPLGRDRAATPGDARDAAGAQRPGEAGSLHGLNDGAIPENLREFFAPSGALVQHDLADIARVVRKLRALSARERALYRRLAQHLSGDVGELEASLDAFFEFRDAYRAALREAGQSSSRPGDAGGRAMQTLRGAEREQAVREHVAAERDRALAHMLAHPGETARGMVEGLHPAVISEEIWGDVERAAAGDRSGLARWAAGAGALGAFSGWLATVAGILYAAALFAPGINLLALAQTALAGGVAAVALAFVQSELHIRAAMEAGSAGERSEEIRRAAEAQVAGYSGAAMMASGVAMKILGRVRLPGRLHSVGAALRMARGELGRVTGGSAALEAVRQKLLQVLYGEHAALPRELAVELLRHERRVARLESMPAGELFDRVARGDRALGELAGLDAARARSLRALAEQPGGHGVLERVRHEIVRALREAPGEARVHIDDVVAALDDAIADVQGAGTPEAMMRAIDELEGALDTRARAARSAALDREAIRQRVSEQVHEPAAEPPVPGPPEAAPAGMSEALQAQRAALGDARAVAQLDAMFAKMRGDSARLERAIAGMRRSAGEQGVDLETRLRARWGKENAGPTQPYGDAVLELPELRARAEALKQDVELYASNHPEIRGVGDWHERLGGEINRLKAIANGKKEATFEQARSARANLDGVQAELRATLQESGVVEVGRKVKLPGAEDVQLELDIVASQGKRLVEVKRVEPFGVRSTSWNGKGGLENQAQRLARYASTHPVKGQPPVVVFRFPRGVGESVAKALQRIARDEGVPFRIVGPVIPDSRLVIPPARPHSADFDIQEEH